MSAEKELLEFLHEEVAKHLLAKLRSGEATAADVSAAIKFLKDNGIEAMVTKGSPVGDLLEGLDVDNVVYMEDRIGSR